jgi:hypothetical protein
VSIALLRPETEQKTERQKTFADKMSCTLVAPEVINACWSADFMSDALWGDRRFRTFNVVCLERLRGCIQAQYMRGDGLAVMIHRALPPFPRRHHTRRETVEPLQAGDLPGLETVPFREIEIRLFPRQGV